MRPGRASGCGAGLSLQRAEGKEGVVPARPSQTLERPCTWWLLPAGARRPPGETAGGSLSSNPTRPAHGAPNFAPRAPATYRVGFVSGQCWGGNVVKPGLAWAQSWYRHLLAESAEKEDITHCWKLFFSQLNMRFPLPASPFFELSKTKFAGGFIQCYTLTPSLSASAICVWNLEKP